MELSNCCDAPRWKGLESDICGSCKEHAGFYDDEEIVCVRAESRKSINERNKFISEVIDGD